ncbi:probable cyclic nucleotide-gated ion channel 10 [Pistacia vera]|uniref:probable cyclic nucleotide-gated ion channel 10 n=1 Tax=Pistacia vera TaxID=55513 RepID=UPI0012639AC5|nr:probable cyclic nucleotide-gated ion channel 10 [Pistacia vera]
MSLALEEGTARKLNKRELLKHKSTEELPKSSFLDPMFFYTRVINDEKRCISVEKSWGIAATLLRSVFDLFYIFHYTSTSGLINLYKTARIRFFMDLVAIFPLPQMIVILSMFQSTRKKCIWNALYVLIVQHALRSIRVATLLTERRTSGTFSEWAAVFMLSYMYASHMFGALWFYTAIGRETEFWEAGFKNLTGCTIHVPPYCDQTKYLKNVCLKELNTNRLFASIRNRANSSTYQLSIPSANEQYFSSFIGTIRGKSPSVTTLLSVWNGQNATGQSILGNKVNYSVLSSMVSDSSHRKSFIESSIVGVPHRLDTLKLIGL